MSMAPPLDETICDDGQTRTAVRRRSKIPKLGPEPVLLSRKEVDALYEILDAVRTALQKLRVEYIVTGGSLLGAIRQHSILFCDDDIDIAILWNENDTPNNNTYEDVVVPKLQKMLGNEFVYQVRPWEGGDRVRSKRINNVFLDLFVIRKYQNEAELRNVIGIKKNGQSQPQTYVQDILDKLHAAVNHGRNGSSSLWLPQPLFPCWHFSTRKAIEMWVREVYKEWELYPLQRELKFGPLVGIQGPHTPVRLLKRAFGDDCFQVYYQSASHKESKHATTAETNSTFDSTTNLPPLTHTGGTWEGGQKAPLQEEHYVPMQPVNRAKRRPTLHCKQSLLEYLQNESAREEKYYENTLGIVQSNELTNATYDPLSNERQLEGRSRPRRTVYLDGVFDLFHIGHLEAIQQCAILGDRVIIGVTGDEDATGYKRRPIAPEDERVAIVKALSIVDEVVCPCPLIVTEAFMKEFGIDLVVHGFANDADAERQREFFEIPVKLGKFQRISYFNGLSTTDRIRNIHQIVNDKETNSHSNQTQEDDKSTPANTKWFGASLAAASGFSPVIPIDPFPLPLRIVMEAHIEKARINRKEALNAIRCATGEAKYEDIMTQFRSIFAKEIDFKVHEESLFHPLVLALFASANLPPDTDLSLIHTLPDKQAKDRLLYELTQNPGLFHAAYDNFVLNVCAPRFAASMGEDCTEIYYQSFPCVRIVQPNEFSIGPHADVAYGHHPCSVNFYVPLTRIGGTSSLFLESRPGAEDWHSLEGNLGNAKHFAGAICMHWTTDNTTPFTRVSLDFRLIEGQMYHSIQCGGDQPGGKMDVYRKTPGYYSKCVREVLTDGGFIWKRVNPTTLSPPDYRVGFPWTVKSWDKFWGKQNHGT
ncbi:glycerol-3-phosphate cytidylyltransferase [Nitzschia inconspicua]|uniref:Glycerol-3-phosphate cytidylyltransferase n=1 Tax=Nitzschia inconspicua TaxID=303405 RepID=A0A9K3M2I5_9STRA|nr:glycerol-3-phosphate cytidylyltransferase [Nitzschia inconspicua]